jgi:hypothetical protein
MSARGKLPPAVSGPFTILAFQFVLPGSVGAAIATSTALVIESLAKRQLGLSYAL